MLKRILTAAAAVAMVATAGLAEAQQGATLVLRSGERVQVEIVDHNAQGLAVRQSGADRTYSINDVAVIDFRGNGDQLNASEYARVGGGAHAAVLGNGEVVVGSLEDIGGRQPLRITMRVDGATRDFTSNDVQRIYFARPPAASAAGAATTPGQLGPGGSVRVPGNTRWVDTGLNVQKGQRVTFNASGEVTLSNAAGDVASPAGSKTGRYPSSPMARVLAGALIGRIGRTEIFAIGNQTNALPMPESGRLFLGINDDAVEDNGGAFEVTVAPGLTPTTRR